MSMACLDNLELCCNWNAANKRNLKDAITIGTAKNVEITSDIDDIVKLETCVQLFNPNSSPSTPELKFRISNSFNIYVIKLISEARIIELYGQGGEYLSTIHSEFVDDFEEMAVYSAVLKLDMPSSECSVKFNKLKHRDNFWLYGIGIYVEDSNNSKNDSACVNIQSVSDRLKQSSCNLTGNAGQCMKLLQTFQSFGISAGCDYQQTKALDQHQTQKVITAETSRKLCDLLLQMPPFYPKAMTESSTTTVVEDDFKKLSASDSPKVEVHHVIAEQFREMEKRLFVKFDKRLSNIEQKLDSLLLLVNKDINLKSDQDLKK